MDHAKFFDAVRPMFGGLKKTQVEGIELLLDASTNLGLSDQRHVAYLLATAKHETADTMQPIAEYGKGKGKPYGRKDPETGQTYYGRGYVQLTWRANYAKASKLTGLALEEDPDQAMDPSEAALIAIRGMQTGMFTGKKFSDYFDATHDDPINARKIINGLDKAKLIAGYYTKFLTALKGA